MTVAVAANFSRGAEQLSAAFEAASGHDVILVIGSTGKLAAQVSLGAPFDVFLAADEERPARLVADGHAVAGTQFTYSHGTLSLIGAGAAGDTDAAAVLKRGAFKRLAIANPKFAPFGRAAMEVFTSLGVSGQLSGKLIYGENVQQAFAYAASGNADWALVSSVLPSNSVQPGALQILPVDTDLYAPIRQDAVLLKHGQANAAALGFIAFVRSEAGQKIIVDLGYLVAGEATQ